MDTNKQIIMETIVTPPGGDPYLAEYNEKYKSYALVTCKEKGNKLFGIQKANLRKDVANVENIIRKALTDRDMEEGGFVTKYKGKVYGFMVEVEYFVSVQEGEGTSGETLRELELENFKVYSLKWDNNLDEKELTVTKEIKDILHQIYSEEEWEKLIG